MDIPKDLGQRIVAATRLAVSLHGQQSLQWHSFSGGTRPMECRSGFAIGGADFADAIFSDRLATDGQAPVAETPVAESEAA